MQRLAALTAIGTLLLAGSASAHSRPARDFLAMKRGEQAMRNRGARDIRMHGTKWSWTELRQCSRDTSSEIYCHLVEYNMTWHVKVPGTRPIRCTSRNDIYYAPMGDVCGWQLDYYLVAVRHGAWITVSDEDGGGAYPQHAYREPLQPWATGSSGSDATGTRIASARAH